MSQPLARYEDAIRLLRELAVSRSLPAENVTLEECVGRVTAEPVVNESEWVPSFDNSAMDGFSLASSATAGLASGRALRLPVAGCLFAGDSLPGKPPGPDVAWEIMTGAPMPGGAHDAVIKVEETVVRRDPDGRALEVEIRRMLEAGENLREKGEDYRPGQRVLDAGARVLSTHLLGFASLGVSQIRVRRRPRVAVISTGRELVAHTESVPAPSHGSAGRAGVRAMIRNSTGPFLCAGLREAGADARYLGVVPDDPAGFEGLVEGVLADSPDLVITTGAVSMGQLDFVPSSLEKLGARIHLHKVAIRPGKPLLVADWARGSTVFIGVPGNPVSTAVGLRFFIEPYLRALQGLPPELAIRLPLAAPAPKPEGLRCFFKARVETEGGASQVRSLAGQASFMVNPLLDANAWVVFPEEGKEARGMVDVYSLRGWS